MDSIAVRLIFRSDFGVEEERYDVPEPGPRQVLVRVTRSQVSAGSEMNFYRLNPPDGPLVRQPLGYMTVGRVEQIGGGVTGFAPGDRVLTCGYHGSHWLVDLSEDGPNRPDGDYIEHLDDGIAEDEAGFVILGDVALHGIRRAALQIDESVVVFGCGIVGQLTIQLARIAGAYPIVAVDLFDSRLDLAKQSGATHVVNAATTDPVIAVREITGGRGGEAVFHCAPVAGVLQTAMEAAAERGKVVLTASAPGKAEIGLQVELLRHELTILGVYEIGIDQPHGYWPWSRPRNRRACLRLLASGQLRLDHLISHVVPPTEAEAMFRMMARGGDDWMGIVFDWDAR
ncbi:MAG TPA: zinc-binding alcohol dehydrogenase [Thermomicrobiales bacterium]|nr:zinc-binding alcohol dehydrogenase [Thermomicrobiales bacterium]